jgi:hypothetical protein
MANFTILEPMSTGDVIDRSVRIYRRNFAPLLSIVAVPSFIGYLATTFFWYGYSKMILGSVETGVPEYSPTALLMLAIGGILYPCWMFAMLLTVAGMSRVIGDHIMLSETITFRKCFSAARKRIGDIFLMGLLGIVILIVVYFIISIIAIVAIMIAALFISVTSTSGMPPWVVGTITGIAALLAVAFGIAAALYVIARVVFLPQVLMIEGQTAGLSIGRAMQLGKGNWHRVGGIVLFTYFVSLSLLTALTLPVLAGLYFTGILTAEFMVSPTWNIIYSSFSQLSNLLCLPIWITSYTLLYFDSRVRKEAYDLELLAREVNPGFYWQPPKQASVMGYNVPNAYNAGREFVQTSPLGLAGWRPNQSSNAATGASESREMKPLEIPNIAAQSSPPEPPFEPRQEATNETFPEAPAQHREFKQQLETTNANCNQCGFAIETGARFCMRCGAAVS